MLRFLKKRKNMLLNLEGFFAFCQLFLSEDMSKQG